MNYIYINYSHPDVEEFVACLEAQFQLTDEVNVLASTVTFRRQQGVVVVAWNGMVDLGFLQQLNGDLDVVDYSPTRASDGIAYSIVIQAA
jgi:hypothetical protein